MAHDYAHAIFPLGLPLISTLGFPRTEHEPILLQAPMNITGLVSVRARERPNAPAVLTADATLSYDELDRAVSWTALQYRKAGLAEGDIVAIHLPNQVQHFIASLALARLGAGQIAFNGRDQPWLQQELVRRLEIVAIIAEQAVEFDAGTPRVDPPPDDLAKFDPDGVLIHHGRADDLMIMDGINIYPAEIENALLKHDSVAEAAVFPDRSVEHRDIPVAAIVAKSKLSKRVLRAHCRTLLGAHTPKHLMIVPKLPRNAAGKVVKSELLRQFRHGGVDQSSRGQPRQARRTIKDG